MVDLTIDKVKTALAQISDCRDDHEEAHVCEDNLYLTFIESVARTADDADLRELAELILTAREIEFERYCS